MRSDRFAYSQDGKRNLTLEGLQEALSKSLNILNDPDQNPGRHTCHLILGKGDWKFRREWLEMERHYSLADRICPRCLASGLEGAATPWFDPVLERFNNSADLQTAMQTRVGNIWLPGQVS